MAGEVSGRPRPVQKSRNLSAISPMSGVGFGACSRAKASQGVQRSEPLSGKAGVEASADPSWRSSSRPESRFCSCGFFFQAIVTLATVRPILFGVAVRTSGNVR